MEQKSKVIINNINDIHIGDEFITFGNAIVKVDRFEKSDDTYVVFEIIRQVDEEHTDIFLDEGLAHKREDFVWYRLLDGNLIYDYDENLWSQNCPMDVYSKIISLKDKIKLL